MSVRVYVEGLKVGHDYERPIANFFKSPEQFGRFRPHVRLSYLKKAIEKPNEVMHAFTWEDTVHPREFWEHYCYEGVLDEGFYEEVYVGDDDDGDPIFEEEWVEQEGVIEDYDPEPARQVLREMLAYYSRREDEKPTKAELEAMI